LPIPSRKFAAHLKSAPGNRSSFQRPDQ
jgi:hypothetical protein